MARNNPEITVIGLGTQDNLTMANDFVTTYGTTSFTMLWDQSGSSWTDFGVIGQPSWLLFDTRGIPSMMGLGGIDEGTILSLLPDLGA